MRTFYFFNCILIASLSSIAMAQTEPKAKKIDKTLTIHGHERHDPYFWMNERDSKDVLEYVEAENKYAADYFTPLKPLQNRLLEEFDQRIDPEEKGTPAFIDGTKYQIASVMGKDYREIYRFEGDKKTVFIDQNKRAEGKSYYSMARWALAPNKKILAFSEDYVGRRKYSILFRDEKTGKLLQDEIKDTDGSLVWANDNKSIFYVRKDLETLREFQVFRHVIGTPSTQDQLVFQENDEAYGVSISKSISKRFIEISCYSSLTTETLFIDANKPEDAPKVFLHREKGHRYEVSDHENGFYVLSNLDAPNNQVLFYSEWPNRSKQAQVLIAHNPKKLLEQLLVLKHQLIFQSRENGLPSIELFDIAAAKIEQISMEEETYSLSLGYNDDFNATSIFYSYNSLTTPASVYRLDLSTRKSELFFQQKLRDVSFKASDYTSKRVWATANDGTQIPISLVYKKGTVLKDAPILLYAYGSYGYTISPYFSATRLSLLDRGFVYAIAHIRGGKYLGEAWYEDGKFLKKKHSFTDFINAAEYLGAQGYCDQEKIYAQGGSAGGLLMGAVTNLAPYLWKGVVAQVPFVDVVSTMLDESIPLTVGEYDEWGNPNEEQFYWYMHNYSPYDQVKKMDYPALLVTTGYHDSQVQYWEPLKWVAKLRDYRTNDKPLLFDCNMDAGHGGGSGRTSERLETAKVYSFILGLEGHK